MDDAARKFKIWDFSPSHDRLLLRSPKDAAHKSNVDIAFFGVEYLELPTALDGLSIGEPTEHECRRVSEMTGSAPPKNRILVLESGGRRHLIVAVAYKVSENDLDIFTSSLSRI